MILLSQFGMRKKLSAEEIKKLDFPVIGWPIAPILATAFMIFVIAMIGYFPDSRPALYVGAAWLALLAVAYKVWVKRIETSKTFNIKKTKTPKYP